MGRKRETDLTFNNLACSGWFAIFHECNTLTEPYRIQSYDRDAAVQVKTHLTVIQRKMPGYQIRLT